MVLTHLPEPKRILIEKLTSQLSKLDGMAAVVLGGSYANRAYNETSDIDLGLYYREAKPFSINRIRRIAEAVSTSSGPTVTDFYEWGPWVNGGAWIHTDQGKVDFIYRNLDQLERTIADAHRGINQHDYDQQPTNGFYSVIYLAETKICIPLFDPDRLIANLKRQVEIYPPELKQRVIVDSLWSAEFTLLYAHGYASQGDIYNTVGCLTRVASYLTQALFALNERYFISDKKVMETIAVFPKLPVDYIQRVESLLSCPGWTAEELTRTVNDLDLTWRSVVALTGELYQPKFRV